MQKPNKVFKMIKHHKAIKVKCKPENLPEAITVDVSGLDVGNTVLVRELPALEGVTVRHPGSDAVVGVMKAK